jgi:hypothetical protein
LHPQESPNDLISALPVVYSNAAKFCPQLDVRLLLGSAKPQLAHFFDNALSDTDVISSGTVLRQKKYDYVAVGGTFYRFHYGHKLMLSTSILLANKYVLCGVTDTQMNKSKLV